MSSLTHVALQGWVHFEGLEARADFLGSHPLLPSDGSTWIGLAVLTTIGKFCAARLDLYTESLSRDDAGEHRSDESPGEPHSGRGEQEDADTTNIFLQRPPLKQSSGGRA